MKSQSMESTDNIQSTDSAFERDIEHRFIQQLGELTGIDNIYIAFSGGMDSRVLLRLMRKCLAAQQLLPQYANVTLPTLVAIHVNHQLQHEAAEWQQQCAHIAQQESVAFVAVPVDVKQEASLEQAARRSRYQVFSQQVKTNDWLLTGHHQNDQAETLLFRLLRGAGVRGMTCMSTERSLGQHSGMLKRPLLNMTYTELKQYAMQQQLQWIDDPSNQTEKFDRNYLRHSVIPMLQARWPSVIERVNRSIQYQQEAQDILDDVATSDLNQCLHQQEALGESISVIQLLRLSKPRQNNLVRYWLKDSADYDLSENLLNEVFMTLIPASQQNSAVIRLKGSTLSLRMYQTQLYLTDIPYAIDNPTLNMKWCAEQQKWNISLNDHHQYIHIATLMPAETSDDSPDNKAAELLQVRTRINGERIRLVGKQHSQSLKKLLQEKQLMPWLRNILPVFISSQHKVIQIADLLYCDPEVRFAFQWRKGLSKARSNRISTLNSVTTRFLADE